MARMLHVTEQTIAEELSAYKEWFMQQLFPAASSLIVLQTPN